ncbi:hypothetical protein [Kibdelosporangium philippinense]
MPVPGVPAPLAGAAQRKIWLAGSWAVEKPGERFETHHWLDTR